MPTPEEVLAGYQKSVADLRTAVVGRGLRIWGALPDYRDADIDRFVKQIVPVVQAGKLRTATLTAAYMRQSARARGDFAPMALAGREVILEARKVDPGVEYRRPAVALYTALSNGRDLSAAISEGASRLTVLLETDLQLAKTTQSQASLAQGGYTYYRRVLSGSENCALCAIASTQRYKVSELMPIHGHCDCSVEAVTAGYDPGQVLDPDLLSAVHQHIEATGGVVDASASTADYRQLIVTHENGEYGPVLAWASDHFTGPDQLAA
jgi:hemolysin-activating ACP:hemolysin acyltransferase